MKPIHIVGGGLAGSEAAWQIARAGLPVVLHEMRPLRGTEGAPHRSARRARLLQFLPLRRRRKQRGRRHSPRNASARLAHHGRGRFAPGAGRRRARGRPRRIRRSGGRRHSRRAAHRLGARRGRRPAARRLGSDDHRHRPADVARAGAGDSRPDGRRCARFLRRDRADRACRFDRHGHSLAPVALRQGRPRRHRRRLRQLPDGPRPIWGVRRRAAGGGKVGIPRIRGHALFRRLPADRGDGRAGARDASARSDEAGRPHQRSCADSQAPCRGAIAPG